MRQYCFHEFLSDLPVSLSRGQMEIQVGLIRALVLFNHEYSV